MANVVEHRKFSLTELGTNHNKFWNVTLYDNGDVISLWGRQGDSGQQTPWAGAGKSFMEKKIREKEKKGYVENKTIDVVSSNNSISRVVNNSTLKDIAKKQIKASCPLVQDLIEDLIKINAHNILVATGGKIEYDSSSAQFKTTQGIVIPEQVDEARILLNSIADYVSKNDFHSSIFQSKLNEYLSLIPRDFGRRRLSGQDILPSLVEVQKENSILDGLATSFIDAQVKPTKTTKKTKEPVIFNVELSLIKDRDIISHIRNLYQSTRKRMHTSNNLSVTNIYAVKIKTMKSSFDKYGAKLKDIRQLWHGTKASNLLSILKQGLIIPPSQSAHVTGRMYGDGLYFSSISTKALNYATNFWGNGGNTDKTFMFLSDVAMGNYYLANGGWSSYPKKGYDSTWAKGGHSGVINDEMIVYRLDQSNLVYLVEFSPR